MNANHIVNDAVVISSYTDEVLAEFFNEFLVHCSGERQLSKLISLLPIVKQTPEIQIQNYLKAVDCSLTVLSVHSQTKSHEPKNFMVLAEPGSEDAEIVCELTKTYGCIHICPSTLLQDEIERGSALGKWIKLNQIMSKPIAAGVILELLTRKLEEVAGKRKGFVLTGFPVVPAHPLNGELQSIGLSQMRLYNNVIDGVIEKTVGDKAQKLLVSLSLGNGSVGEINPPESNDTKNAELQPISNNKSAILSANSEYTYDKHDYIAESITQQPTSENQQKPPQDVYNNFFDTINTRFPTTEKSLRKYIKNQLDIILQLSSKPDIIFYLAQQCCDKDAIRQNYNDNSNRWGAVNNNHQLLQHNDNLDRQWQRYESCMDLVQQFLMHYPSENVLQLNGVKFMKEYLANVPVQQIVQPFIVSQFTGLQNLRELCQRNLIHPSFKWKLSDFGERCPVSMRERRLKQGSLNYAVNYKGTIYVLSSKAAMDSFLQAPDEFLELQPTCRLVIMGAQSTGKTTLADLLADLMNAVSISGSKFKNIESWRKYDRWILDGMRVDTKDWDTLLDNQLQPDVVLILQDKSGDVVRQIYQRSPSTKFRNKEYVVSHIRKYFGHLVEPHPMKEGMCSSSTETLKQEIALQVIDEAVQGVCESTVFEQLLLDYENYQKEIDALKLYFREKGIPYIEVQLSVGTWTEVLIDAVSKYLNFFICPPQERAIDTDKEALLFGDFGEYCPVTLNGKDLLRKGNPLLHVEFKNKSYFFASEVEKRKFLDHPELFVRPVRVPPPRIFITGPSKTGKTTMAQLLSEKYEIPAVSNGEIFENGLKHYFQQQPYYERGVIIDGYPATMEDSTFMAESQLLPDVLLILGAMEETATCLEDRIAATFTSSSDISIELMWKKIDRLIQRFIHRENVLCTTRELDMDTAHALLKAGLFRYSRFQQRCPVTNHELINMRANCAGNDANITPVLYSDEVYFLRGFQRLTRFRANPKKYTVATNHLNAPVKNKLIVCGPPLFGTSSLCERCAQEYSVPVLKTDESSEELLTCLKTRYQAGWILDNPKLTVELLQTLRECGEEPTAIFVIKGDAEALWKNFGKSNKLKKTNMVQLAQRFADRYEQHEEVLEMLQTQNVHRYKNVKFLDFCSSSWKVWNDLHSFLLETATCTLRYERNMEVGKPASLKRLNVSKIEIDARFSIYQNYCPFCYLQNGKLVLYEHLYEPSSSHQTSIYSKNEFHDNLVQWKQEVFWCCNRHINEFINQLTATDKLPMKLLPKNRPKLVHSYSPELVINKGYCVVSSNTTESSNSFRLSHQNNVKGLPEFAVFYEQKVFLLANEEAALQFLEEPHKYANRQINFMKERSQDTPVQNTTCRLDDASKRLLREALKACSSLRPKHFDVPAAELAAIFVGLFLKAKNPANNSMQRDFYDHALSNFLQKVVVRKKRLEYEPLQTDVCNINNILNEIIQTAIE